MWNSAGDSGDGEASTGESGSEDAVPVRPNGDDRSVGGVGSPGTDGDDRAPVVAEIVVDHRDVVLHDAITAAPSVTVEPNYRTTDDRSPVLVFTAVDGPLDEFGAALATDRTVRNPALLARTEDTRAYRVRYGPDTLRFTPVLSDLGALLYEARAEGGRWTFRVRFPSRAAFTALRSYCSTNDVELTLSRLYRDGETAAGGTFGLTDRQWETLSIAHEMGYFEVPRATSQEELARRLDVSPSAVSQRIRRATNQLLGETLDPSRFDAEF